MRLYVAGMMVLVACGGPAGRGGDPAGDGAASGDSLGGDPGGDVATGDTAACPLGHACNPIPIDAFPFVDTRDTRQSTSSVIDSYACAAATNESGAEVFYRVSLTEAGVLYAYLDDQSGDDIDIDLHLLSGPDGDSCLVRDNVTLGWFLAAGDYYLTADTWVSGVNGPMPGPYELTVELFPTGSGTCAMTPVELKMFWDECDGSLDCREGLDPGDGVVRRWLTTPAYGPVVKEAHLVTVSDDFSGGWPQSFTDGITAHYTLSEAATGYGTTRTEPWAPAGEGGSEYGQGAVGVYLPVVAEAWYVNMYWRDRPAQGTRLLVVNPENGRAVVAAGGYETGPGSNTAIGGAVEEILLYLGTSHRDGLVFGFAIDDSLAYGPIDCGW